MSIPHLLKAAKLTSSTSEAVRMIQQQAVRIDGSRVVDKNLVLMPGNSMIVQVGKRRFARVHLKQIIT